MGSACPSGADAGAAQACRAYWSAVCARIRECEAPLVRPCESPIDACPNILFADGSGFTVEGIVACTERWKMQDCGALDRDEGPECSRVAGTREVGAACVFDSQCRTGRCSGGVVPSYQATCGVCVEVAESHQACLERRVCPAGQRCQDAWAAVPADLRTHWHLRTGRHLRWSPHRHLCAARRGRWLCGSAQCVDGAYCNIGGYDHVPSHICYALGQTGDACDATSSDQGKEACASGLDCRCDDSACETASCQPSPLGVDSCVRFTAFGREKSTCAAGEECLYTDDDCATARCAKPRNFGESCDDTDAVCRQGLTCVAGQCAEHDRDFEGLSCGGP